MSRRQGSSGREVLNTECVYLTGVMSLVLILHCPHNPHSHHNPTHKQFPQWCIILTFMPTATVILDTNELSSLAFLFLQSTNADVFHIVVPTYWIELVGTLEMRTTTFHGHGRMSVNTSLPEATLQILARSYGKTIHKKVTEHSTTTESTCSIAIDSNRLSCRTTEIIHYCTGTKQYYQKKLQVVTRVTQSPLDYWETNC